MSLEQLNHVSQRLKHALERGMRTNDLNDIIDELVELISRVYPTHLKSVTRNGNFTIGPEEGETLFIFTAAVAVTLPTKREGLFFRFVQTADNDMTITGNADLIHKGSITGTSVIFSTAGQKRGSQAVAECIDIGGGVLKWLIHNIGGTTATVV